MMFLSARDAEIDRVVGLEIGADDYVVKPFSPREVAARVRAILKRVGPGVAPGGVPGGPGTHADHLSGQPLSLTRHGYSACCRACWNNPSGVQPRAIAGCRRRTRRMPATSAISTAISKACAANCVAWRRRPNRSRPIAASATATARATADAPGAADFPGVRAVYRPHRLLSCSAR